MTGAWTATSCRVFVVVDVDGAGAVDVVTSSVLTTAVVSFFAGSSFFTVSAFLLSADAAAVERLVTSAKKSPLLIFSQLAIFHFSANSFLRACAFDIRLILLFHEIVQ